MRRARLTDLIDGPSPATVTTIIAGAGYGKTTLAVEWAGGSSRRVGWLTLRETDDDPTLLVSRLRAALPGASGRPDGPAAEPRHPWRPRAGDPDALWDDLASIDRPSCLILDNVDWLTDLACTDLLDELIVRSPESCRVVLISRTRLPLRLGRLRSLGQIRELGVADLELTEEETAEMLSGLVPDGLDPDDIRRIWHMAEGWLTGVRLAGMAIAQAARDAGRRDDRFGARDPDAVRDAYLDEYVQEEVVGPLPDDLRDLALASADLPFVSADLCDAALEIGNSRTMLAWLDDAFGFLAPAPTGPDRYRHHRLVGDSLRRLSNRAIPEETRQARRRRAAAWLLAEDELQAAAELSLESGDWRWVAEAIEPLCRGLADRSDFEALLAWVDRVPDAVLNANPTLRYWSVVARLGLGRTLGVQQVLDEVEPRWHAAGDPVQASRIAFCRGMLAYWEGSGREAERHLTDALQQLPRDAYMERLQATTFLGRLAFREGRDREAGVVLDAAVAYAVELPTDDQWAWAVLAPDRGNAYALRGDLPSAITKYRLLLAEMPTVFQARFEGLYRCRLVNLAIERNDLETATRELEIAEGLIGDERRAWHHDAWIARARLLLASGRREEAERCAVGHVQDLRGLPDKNQLVLLLASIWLERGELSMVRSWLRDSDTVRYPWAQVFGDINYRALAISLSLAEGNVEPAADAARRLTAEAAATQRWADFIGLSTRWAIALHQLGKLDEARAALAPALERGVKGGFVRSFHVPGVDAAWVSADLWGTSRGALRIKDALQDIVAGAPEGSETMLSGREVEVLRLVAKGRGNRQIADDMFISINTVRNHLVRISRRLEASSRSEAVAKARRLGILD